MFSWLFSWVPLRWMRPAEKEAQLWSRKVERLVRRLQKAEHRLRVERNRLASLQSDIEMWEAELFKRVRARGAEELEKTERRKREVESLLDEAKQLIADEQRIVKALEEENRVLNDTVIPALVAGNRLIQERCGAEIAKAAALQGMLQRGERNGTAQ